MSKVILEIKKADKDNDICEQCFFFIHCYKISDKEAFPCEALEDNTLIFIKNEVKHD